VYLTTFHYHLYSMRQERQKCETRKSTHIFSHGIPPFIAFFHHPSPRFSIPPITSPVYTNVAEEAVRSQFVVWPLILSELIRLTRDIQGRLRVHEKCDNQAIQTQDLSENEYENHANEKTGLLRSTPNTGITNDTNGESCSQTS